MSRREAEAVLGGSLAIDQDSTWKDCGYAPTRRLPPGTRIMVENGTVARVEVDSGADLHTSAGARVGDSEDRIRALYPGRVETTPHKYTDGHYLTVTPASPADSLYRIVFETDGRRVLRFRAGRLPQVRYVEGCA